MRSFDLYTGYDLFQPPIVAWTREAFDLLTCQEVNAIVDVDQASAVADWIIHVLRTTSRDRPWTEGIPPVGTWSWSSGVYQVLIAIDPERLVHHIPNPRDLRREANHPTYIGWYRQGCIPPPVTMIETRWGGWTVLGQRRVLAAHDAGCAWLPAWYNPTTADGRPRWHNLEKPA